MAGMTPALRELRDVAATKRICCFDVGCRAGFGRAVTDVWDMMSSRKESRVRSRSKRIS